MSVSAAFNQVMALGGVVVAFLLAGCQASPPEIAEQNPKTNLSISIDAPEVWGGEVRCAATACRLIAVEHEENALVLHATRGRESARLLDRVALAYHPDSARWLSDDLVAAAVEGTGSIEVFRVSGERLLLLQRVEVGFAPRDVLLVSRDNARYQLLATPYSGNNVTWIEWTDGPNPIAKTVSQRICRSPWHPRKVPFGPGGAANGIVVGCLDDNSVLFMSGQVPGSATKIVAQFDHVPRNVVPSPSGKWWYVALEVGARNARIDARTGAIQWLQAPVWGAVSAAPLTDDMVVWGEDQRVFLQKYSPDGEVLETRTLPASGFPTGLQLIDVDADGVSDLVVYNSAGKRVDVHFGPLWDNAVPTVSSR